MQRKSIISKTDDRLHWVDAARGLAMLCVILGHMGLTNANYIIYSFHIPLFFMIAGYFQKKQDSTMFIKKKARLLLVPYLFSGAVLIFSTQLNNIAKIVLHRDDAISPLYLLKEWVKAIFSGNSERKNFIFMQSDIVVGAIWFLLALFFAQVIVNLLIDKKYGFLSTVLIAVIGIISAKFIWLPLSIQAGAAAAIYVAVGHVYNYVWRGGTLSDLLKKKTVIVSCFCIWILYLCISFYFNNILGLVSVAYPIGIFDYIDSIAAVIVVLFVSYQILDKIPLLNTFLAWFGKNSLIVLCFHLIEMTAVPFLSVIDFGLSLVGIDVFYLSIILTVVAKVLWCCFAILIVNKSRMLKWVFNIKNKNI